MLNEDAKIKNILGKTGSGKTLITTEEWVIPALLDKEEVWTCFWVNWRGYLDENGQLVQNWHYFKPRDFHSIAKLRNAVIIFDEYRQSFDPRRYEDETEEVRAFFELHRHRHNDIRGNTQDVSLVAKTIGIQAHEWSQVEQLPQNWLWRIWDWIKGQKVIRIQRDFLTFQELKKMANGWELGEDVALDAEWVIHKYNVDKLVHRELNDYKQELVYPYCPKCRYRQGWKTGGKTKIDGEMVEEIKDQIKREEMKSLVEEIIDKKGRVSYRLKEDRYCARHQDQLLELKESGMFDTDYEPETHSEEYIVKKYRECKACGQLHIVK